MLKSRAQCWRHRCLAVGFWALILALFALHPALAKTPALPDVSFSALEDPEHALTLEQVRTASFGPFESVLANAGPSRSRYWVRGELPTSFRPQQWVLELAGHVELNRVCVYWPRLHQAHRRQCAGLDLGAEHGWRGAYRFSPPADLDLSAPFYLAGQSDSWFRMPIAFVPRAGLELRSERNRLFWGAYYGAMLALCFCAMVAWLTLGYSAFAFFALHLSAATLAFACWEGVPLEQAWWATAWWITQAPSLLLGLFCASGVVFYGRFLRVETRHPKIARVFVLCALPGLATAIASLFDPTLAYRLLGLAGLSFAVGTTTLALYCSWQGERQARQVLAAMGLLLVAATAKSLEAFGVLLAPQTLSALLGMGVLLGAMAMALGLGIRVRDIRNQRNQARDFAEASRRLAQRQAERDESSGAMVRKAWLQQVEARDSAQDLFFLRLEGSARIERDHGVEAMDALLQEVVERLRRWGGDEALAGRIGTLSFVCAAPAGQLSERGFSSFCEQLHASLSAQYAGLRLRQAQVATTHDARGALRAAQAELWSSNPRSASRSSFSIEATELEPHYQPIRPLHQGPSFCEALLRVRSGDKLLGPDDILPRLKDPQAQRHLTDTMLRLGCAQLEKWGADAPEKLSINLFRSDLMDPELCQRLLKVIAPFAVPPQRLVLEINESTLVQNIARVPKTVDELRAAGFLVAIDDFGSGYTSVAWLRNLRVDWLKIDRSLILDVPQSESARVIIENLASLAAKLQLVCIVEGIEEDRQRRYLEGLAPIWVQGFLDTKPLPALAMQAWLDNHP